MIDNRSKDKNGLFYLTKEDIEEEVENELRSYNSSLLDIPQAIDIDHFLEFHLGTQIEYKSLSEDHTCYGAFSFNPGKLTVYEDSQPKDIFIQEKTIVLDTDSEKLGEAFVRFTLAHEGGHCFTQYNALHKINMTDITKDHYAHHIENVVSYREPSFGKRRMLVSREDWMEWQANYCGACFLMNRSSVLKLLSNLMQREVVYSSGFCEEMSAFEFLTAKYAVSKIYGVSDVAARIRLQELSCPR